MTLTVHRSRARLKFRNLIALACISAGLAAGPIAFAFAPAPSVTDNGLNAAIANNHTANVPAPNLTAVHDPGTAFLAPNVIDSATPANSVIQVQPCEKGQGAASAVEIAVNAGSVTSKAANIAQATAAPPNDNRVPNTTNLSGNNGALTNSTTTIAGTTVGMDANQCFAGTTNNARSKNDTAALADAGNCNCAVAMNTG